MSFHTPEELQAIEQENEEAFRKQIEEELAHPRLPPTNNSRAKQLCYFLRKRLEWISAMRAVPEGKYDPEASRVFTLVDRKSLYCSLLDATATVRSLVDETFSAHVGIGKRWKTFMAEHCDWPDPYRVSVPVLLKRFEHHAAARNPKQASASFMAHLRGIVAQHPDRGVDVRSSHMDPQLDDLLALTTSGFERRTVKSTTMVALLYQLRNFATHQMLEPGAGVDAFVTTTDEPVYHGFNDEPELHLVFPEKWIVARVAAGIDSLEQCLLMHNIDPYPKLKDTSAWQVIDGITPPISMARMESNVGRHCCADSIDAALAEHDQCIALLRKARAQAAPFSTDDLVKYEELLRDVTDRSDGWCHVHGERRP